ncbi:hypothetical protein SCALM49S_03331 [Streptomyces californicus]
MPWFAWLLAAAALGVAEFFTLTLVFGLLAGAALVAAVVAGLGVGLLGQLVALGLTAVAGLALVRPVALRQIAQAPLTVEGSDALIGKRLDPPNTIKEAMEKQMAERDKRAAILHAEGERQAKILTAEGTKQKDILEAQGTQQAMILRADGESKAVELVFQAVHRNNTNAKVLAYKYLETLPDLARSDNNTFWVIPGELTEAIRTVSTAFGDRATGTGIAAGRPARSPRRRVAADAFPTGPLKPGDRTDRPRRGRRRRRRRPRRA